MKKKNKKQRKLRKTELGIPTKSLFYTQRKQHKSIRQTNPLDFIFKHIFG